MKKINILFLVLFSLIFSSVSLSAQTVPVKLGIIDSNAFEDEKAGITKYINAFKQINTEIQPRTNELQTMLTKVQTLEKEVVQMQEAYQKNPNGPIRPEQIQSKADEIEQIKRQGSYKQEDLNKYFQTRKQQVVAPIIKDIADALQLYAKQKGYTVIFDIAKDTTGFMVALGDDKIDVTKDFITFYNSRSAPIVVNSAPKK